MAVRAGSTCLEVGDVRGVAHEGLGGFLGGPLDDDPQGCAFAFTFEAGSPGKIPSSVLGDECVRGSDIVRDPFLGDRRDGKN